MSAAPQAPIRPAESVTEDPEFLMDFRRSLLRLVNVIDKHLAERGASPAGPNQFGKGGKPGT